MDEVHNSTHQSVFSDYVQWVSQIRDSVQRYGEWQTEHLTTTPDQPQHEVAHTKATLEQLSEHITIIVTGEFGRGKTDFINAILAKDTGRKLLPVHVGRATMTPVEIGHAPSQANFLKLLPIEKRLENKPISWYKSQPELWETYSLDTDNMSDIAAQLTEVGKTKVVSLAIAEKLGFDTQFLENSETQADHVVVPAWQHAWVNLKLPSLYGLSIIDTPGFNALGMESLLTEDMIQQAHALIHIVSVETGVTASDYALWKSHIQPAAFKQNMPLFMLINKLDLLDQHEEPIQNSLSRIKRIGTKQLNLDEKNVFALSAKFANQAILESDELVKKRSGFVHFEQYFFKSLINQRIQKLKQGILDPVLEKMSGDISLLQLEIKRLKKDLGKLKTSQTSLEQNYLATKTGIADEDAFVSKQLNALNDNMRDIDLSYEHIMHIFSDQQFRGHRDRGTSILNNDSNNAKGVADTVHKARNVMIAGLRLDMRRIAMDLTVLNNSMRALYKDLDCQFEARKISVDLFTDFINEMENVPLSSNNSAQLVFTNQVADEIYETFRKQRKLISTWHKNHISVVKEPVDLAVKNLDERKALAKQLAHNINDRKEQLAYSQERLPIAQVGLKQLINIKEQLLVLTE